MFCQLQVSSFKLLRVTCPKPTKPTYFKKPNIYQLTLRARDHHREYKGNAALCRPKFFNKITYLKGFADGMKAIMVSPTS